MVRASHRFWHNAAADLTVQGYTSPMLIKSFVTLSTLWISFNESKHEARHR